MKKRFLDHLKYGAPTDEHISKMKTDTPLIAISHDKIHVRPPPRLSKEKTFSEMGALIKALRNTPKSRENFINLSDKKPMSIFKSFASKNGLVFDDEYFEQLKKDLSAFILNLKYKFNRPRPYQIAKEIGIEFPYKHSQTANTPAYPSGHAIQSHVYANALSKMNPEFQRSLENLADNISLARIQQGVHFLSDTFVGKEIADMIDPYIITPYQLSGYSLNEEIRIITREFLREESEADDNGIKKLRILDFDDTIANTAERVLITTDDGAGQKYISSKEFASYSLKPGESIDPNIAFEEFETVDVNMATPVPVISDMLKSFAGASGNRKLLILTARSQDVADDVMNFLKVKLGIPNPEGIIDFVGVSSKDPSAKVDVIQAYLDSHSGIEFVSFYDDSGDNVRAVNNFLDQRGFSRGRSQRDVRQVVKDSEGNVRLVNPDESLSESVDLRSMNKIFSKR